MISRRTLLAAVALVPVSGATWIVLRDNVRPLVARVISIHFGEAIAASEAAKSFQENWLKQLDQLEQKTEAMNIKAGIANHTPQSILVRLDEFDGIEDWIVQDFCNETNVILHLEQGDELSYLGKFDAYDTACSHPLSAQRRS